VKKAGDALGLVTQRVEGGGSRIHQKRRRVMAQYGTKAQKSVKRAMHKRKEGTLKSGKRGKRVTSRKQAIAIGLSEARDKGAKFRRSLTSRDYSAPGVSDQGATQARPTPGERESIVFTCFIGLRQTPNLSEASGRMVRVISTENFA
jgi:hypothetical protein